MGRNKSKVLRTTDIQNVDDVHSFDFSEACIAQYFAHLLLLGILFGSSGIFIHHSRDYKSMKVINTHFLESHWFIIQ